MHKKNKYRKFGARVLSLALSAMMLCTMLPMAASAEESVLQEEAVATTDEAVQQNDNAEDETNAAPTDVDSAEKLKAAMADETVETVRLTQDIPQIKEGLSVKSTSKSKVLDLNGFKLDLYVIGAPITVESTIENFTIKSDAVSDERGDLVLEQWNTSAKPVIDMPDGTLTLQNLNVTILTLEAGSNSNEVRGIACENLNLKNCVGTIQAGTTSADSTAIKATGAIVVTGADTNLTVSGGQSKGSDSIAISAASFTIEAGRVVAKSTHAVKASRGISSPSITFNGGTTLVYAHSGTGGSSAQALSSKPTLVGNTVCNKGDEGWELPKTSVYYRDGTEPVLWPVDDEEIPATAATLKAAIEEAGNSTIQLTGDVKLTEPVNGVDVGADTTLDLNGKRLEIASSTYSEQGVFGIKTSANTFTISDEKPGGQRGAVIATSTAAGSAIRIENGTGGKLVIAGATVTADSNVTATPESAEACNGLYVTGGELTVTGDALVTATATGTKGQGIAADADASFHIAGGKVTAKGTQAAMSKGPILENGVECTKGGWDLGDTETVYEVPTKYGVSGTVNNSDGTPLRAGTVYIKQSPDQRNDSVPSAALTNGTFTFSSADGVKNGSYYLEVWSSDSDSKLLGVISPVVVDGGDSTDHTIQLTPVALVERKNPLDFTNLSGLKKEDGTAVTIKDGKYEVPAEGWSYDVTKNKLTLAGLNMKAQNVSTVLGSGVGGVLVLPEDTSIYLEDGTINRVTNTGATGDATPVSLVAGIKMGGSSESASTIYGDGALFVQSGTSYGSETESTGIHAGALTIGGMGTAPVVSSVAGTASFSVGSGTGDASVLSCGIRTSNTITIENGFLSAKSGTLQLNGATLDDGQSVGIFPVYNSDVEKMFVVKNGVVTASIPDGVPAEDTKYQALVGASGSMDIGYGRMKAGPTSEDAKYIQEYKKERWLQITMPILYGVTIAEAGEGAEGEGNYSYQDSVTVDAGTKADGKLFKEWTVTPTGALGDVILTDAKFSFSMPKENIVLTANWKSKVTTPKVTVLGGGIGASGSGTYKEGVTVSINAGTKDGYQFKNWTASQAVSFANASSASTSFTMPKTSVVVTANWEEIPAPKPTPGPGQIEVDGKILEAATEETQGEKTTVTIDQTKLGDAIHKAAQGSDFVVPVSKNKEATASIVAQNIVDLAANDMNLLVQSGEIGYNLPGTALGVDRVVAEFPGTDPKEIQLDVTIKQSAVKVENAVTEPLEFTITASYNGKKVIVEKLEGYAGRIIEITKEQAGKITTAIVQEADGTQRHVPTFVYQVGDKYFARVNSRTNSLYALIENKVEFPDVENTWFKASANEMGSRKIILGVDGKYEGNRAITRAEFAVELVRALGLPANGDASQFTDVPENAWYAGAVGTAYEYEIIFGQTPTLFAPKAEITREEAMVMIYRAAKIAGYAGKMGDLSSFPDADQVSNFAKEAAAWNVGSELILGMQGKLAPKDSITRAQAGTVLLRLLQKAELVDVRAEA